MEMISFKHYFMRIVYVFGQFAYVNHVPYIEKKRRKMIKSIELVDCSAFPPAILVILDFHYLIPPSPKHNLWVVSTQFIHYFTCVKVCQILYLSGKKKLQRHKQKADPTLVLYMLIEIQSLPINFFLLLPNGSISLKIFYYYFVYKSNTKYNQKKCFENLKNKYTFCFLVLIFSPPNSVIVSIGCEIFANHLNRTYLRKKKFLFTLFTRSETNSTVSNCKSRKAVSVCERAKKRRKKLPSAVNFVASLNE